MPPWIPATPSRECQPARPMPRFPTNAAIAAMATAR